MADADFAGLVRLPSLLGSVKYSYSGWFDDWAGTGTSRVLPMTLNELTAALMLSQWAWMRYPVCRML